MRDGYHWRGLLNGIAVGLAFSGWMAFILNVTSWLVLGVLNFLAWLIFQVGKEVFPDDEV